MPVESDPRKLPNPDDDSDGEREFIKQMAKMGMPVEQIPPEDLADIEESQAKDDKELVDARKSLEAFENKDALTEGELNLIRVELEEIGEAVSRLSSELNQRDQEGFSPLLFTEDLDSLQKSAVNLQSILAEKNINVDELGNAVIFAESVIEGIGKVQQRPGMKEDGQSLHDVAQHLRKILESADNAITKLNPVEKEEADYLKNKLKILNESVEGKYRFVERKRQAFEEI